MLLSTMRSFATALIIGALAGLPVQPAVADDTEVYTTTNRRLSDQVRPNVLFVFDSSGSMNFFDAGKSDPRVVRLKQAFNAYLDTTSNVNIGLARFTVPGGPILYPVSNIDGDANAIDSSGQADVNARIRSGDDDAEEMGNGRGSSGALLPRTVKLDSLQLDLFRPAAHLNGTENSVVLELGGIADDARYAYAYGGLKRNSAQRTEASSSNMAEASISRAGFKFVNGFRFSEAPADTKPSSDASSGALRTAKVQRAYVEFTSAAYRGGDLNLRIDAHVAPDSQSFASSAEFLASTGSEVDDLLEMADVCEPDINLGDIMCRLTLNGSSQTVQWDNVPVIERTDRFVSPDLSPLIQEVFDQPEWMETNSGDGLNDSIALFVSSATFDGPHNWADEPSDRPADASEPHLRQIYNRDGGPGRAPKLFLEYVTASELTARDQRIGLRFDAVRVPQGARIKSATIELVPRSDSEDSISLRIRAENSVNAAPFSDTDNELANRTLLASDFNVVWDLPATERWTAEQPVKTPDLAAQVQTLVDQGDWCGGNAMAFYLTRDSGDPGNRPVYSYESDASKAPILRIELEDEQEYAAGEGCVRQEILRQVSASRDDATEAKNQGSVSLARTTIPVDLYNMGFRFTRLPIPKGATVEAARLELLSQSDATAGSVSLSVAGELIAEAPQFQVVNNDLRSRSRTAAVSTTYPLEAVASGGLGATGDFKDVLQSIIDGTAWESGNAMNILASGTGLVGFLTYDNHPADGARLRATIRYNIGDLAESEQVASVTVRDRLRDIVDDIATTGNTPVVDALLEAALYFRGEEVLYGLNRGHSDLSASNRAVNRVSHPASYTGGTLVRPNPNCTDEFLNSLDCIDEVIEGEPGYVSPIDNACQTNFIVFLSDGYANENISKTRIRSMVDKEACDEFYSDDDDSDENRVTSAEECGIDLVEFLASTDQRPDVKDSNVTTFTIGFNLPVDAVQDGRKFLDAVGRVGNGGFRVASSAQELADEFADILKQVLSQTTSFATPSLSINAFNRLFHRDEVYFSLFEPSTSVFWPGNVKKYNLRSTDEDCPSEEADDGDTGTDVEDADDGTDGTVGDSGDDTTGDGSIVDGGEVEEEEPKCEIGQVLDVNGNYAIATTQRISRNATSNWTLEASAPDGAEIRVGGAGEIERQPLDSADSDDLRRVLVYYGADDPNSLPADSDDRTLVELLDANADGVADGITGTVEADDVDAEMAALEATRQFLGWPGPSVTEILSDAATADDEIERLRTDLNNHIRWIRGVDIDDEDDDPNTLRRYSFGDPLHSSPVAVTYGAELADGETSLNCEDNLEGYDEECVVVKLFVGTNDGAIKMINGYDGVEEWAFYPQATLPNLYTLRRNPEDAHIYGIDGTPTIWLTDQSSTVDDEAVTTISNTPDGIIDPAIDDKVRVLIGQRRGGRMYYALDVTPDAIIDTVADSTSTTPEYLWRIAGGSSDYPLMGETWSRPRVARVLKGGGEDGSIPTSATVIMVAGGYDAATQDGGFSVGNTGNAIYAINPDDGSREFFVAGDPNPSDGISPHPSGDGVEVPAMRYPIPSDLALMDADADGHIDRAYVGDTGGQMWRVDIGPSLDDGGEDGTIGGYKLVAGRLAVVSFSKDEEDEPAVNPDAKNQRKFFYPPDVVSVRAGLGVSALGDYDQVTATTGNRSTPLSLNVQDRYYAFADLDVYRMPDEDEDGLADDLGDPTGSESGTFQGPLDAAGEDPGLAGDLFDVTNDNDPMRESDTTAADPGDEGAGTGDPSEPVEDVATEIDFNGSYYLTFDEPGEKALAAPVILAGIVFFTTYLPEEVLVLETCALAEGGGRLYGLNVLDGSAIVNWDEPDSDDPLNIDDRTWALGAGIPSAAVPVFQPEKVTLLIGGGGGATTVDPGIVLPRVRTYWFEQK